jgi:hypothetical protein
MANSFIDTTVAGKLTVTGNVIDGDNESPLITRINDNYNKLVAMFCNDYGLELTTENGTNWTVDSASAYLVGNILRINFTATRSSAPDGDISTELMGKVIVEDGGKISGGYAVSICTSNTGNPMTGHAKLTHGDTTTTIEFNFSGTRPGNAVTQFSTLVHIPVVLDESYY